MKLFSTIFLSVSLFVIGLSFLSPRSNEEDKHSSDSFIKKVNQEDYHVQYKRRDFIMESREKKLEALKGHRNDRQKAVRSRHDDFIVFNNDDSTKSRYDDFR